MADDEVAVLLQEAIAEMKESTKALFEQNQHLSQQNSLLAEQVKEVVEGTSHKKKQIKPRVKVSIHTKVITACLLKIWHREKPSHI